jgi:hypothetical protein
MKIATCIYLLHSDDRYVQMAQQQRTILGFKGYGGKVKPGQSIKGNAVEELWEETGGIPELRLNKEKEGGIFTREELLIPVGFIDFYNGLSVPFGDPSFRVHFFICRRFAGHAVDTVEMQNHQLFSVSGLYSLTKMVKGDELIIPQMLTGQCIKGDVRRTEDWSRIVEVNLEEVAPSDLDF